MNDSAHQFQWVVLPMVKAAFEDKDWQDSSLTVHDVVG